MRRILVALDGSPRSPHVLDSAVRLARKDHARLRILHAVQVPRDVPAAIWTPSAETLDERALRLGGEIAGEYAKVVPKDRLAGVDVRLGEAWREICAIAKEFDADLIVIGAHGYGLVDRALGTTAANVVNHADRDVLVVRGNGKQS